VLYLRLAPSRRYIPAGDYALGIYRNRTSSVTVTEANLLRDIQIHLPVIESYLFRREVRIRGARKHRPDRSLSWKHPVC
jgi:hypothetical protein